MSFFLFSDLNIVLGMELIEPASYRGICDKHSNVNSLKGVTNEMLANNISSCNYSDLVLDDNFTHFVSGG
jgi:hypothetical protein